MDVRDVQNSSMFVNLDGELLEDVDPPYLTSISDSQLSCRDYVSDYHSSDTLEPNSLNTDKVKEVNREEFSGNLLLRNEKHGLIDSNYKVRPKSKKSDENTFLKVADSKSVEFIDSRSKVIKQQHFPNCVCTHQFTKRLSVSLPDLKMLRVKFPLYRWVNSLKSIRSVRNRILSQSKMFKSLPNLYFSDDYGKKSFEQKELLRKNSQEGNYVHDTFGDWVLVNISKNSFEDYLIKILIKKLHTLLKMIKEKDIMIFELLQAYDKLLVKHAEAENKIDRMRFGYASLPAKTAVTNNENTATKEPIWYNSALSHEIHDSMKANANTYPKHCLGEIDQDDSFRTLQVSVENPSLDYLSWRYLLPVARENKTYQVYLDSNGNSNGSTPQKYITNYGEALNEESAFTKRISKENNENDVESFSEMDINFLLSKPTNKINMDKLETEFLEKSTIDFTAKETFFDHDTSISSEDDFSFGSQKTYESMENACLPQNHSGMSKNSVNFSYNKMLMFAKAKRELISYPEVHQYSSLFYDQNKSGFYESLPNLKALKIQENCLDAIYEMTSFYPPCESDDSKVMGLRSTSIEGADIIHSKLDHRTHTDTITIDPYVKPKNGKIYKGEDSSHTQQPFSILNNNIGEGQCVKNLYGEEKGFQRCVFTEKTGSNIKMFDCDMEEMNPMVNKLHLEIKNDFGEFSKNTSSQNKKWQTLQDKEKSYFVESDCENSNSLDSIKLEACDCWYESSHTKFSHPHMTRTNCEAEPLSSLDHSQIPPLCLELSSSVDNSLPVVSTVSMDNSVSKSCEVLKSLEDLATNDGGMKQRSKILINAKFGNISKRAPVAQPNSCSAGRDAVLLQNAKPPNCCPKKMSQLINSLNKADSLASKLKDKSEELKKYLSLQLENIS